MSEPRSEPRSEHGHPNVDVVAWTDHDGPARPPAGPPTRGYQGLAAGFAAWFALAIVGCEVVHHSGDTHVPITPLETIGGTAVFLGIPAMVVLLNRRHPAGPWLAAVLGFLAAAVSASQWSLAPLYTVVEAGGFLMLGLAGIVLGTWQLRSRLAPDGAVVNRVAASPATAGSATEREPVAAR
jgi:hypothetical protein